MKAHNTEGADILQQSFWLDGMKFAEKFDKLALPLLASKVARIERVTEARDGMDGSIVYFQAGDREAVVVSSEQDDDAAVRQLIHLFSPTFEVGFFGYRWIGTCGDNCDDAKVSLYDLDPVQADVLFNLCREASLLVTWLDGVDLSQPYDAKLFKQFRAQGSVSLPDPTK